jgi:hypothetical protein
MNPLKTLLIALPLAAMTVPAVAKKPQPPVARPCMAANGRINYGKLIRPSVATHKQIIAYKRAWKAFCANKSGSINKLLTMAQRIDEGVGRAINAANNARRLAGKNADRAHDDLQKRWPSFVPAFMGSIIEFEFFRVQMWVIHRYAKWGDANDKLFFAEERKIFGNDEKSHPWVRRTWDYGGCTLFGKYDWAGNIRKVDGLRARLGGWYKRRLGEYHADMKHTIGLWAKNKEICTCGTAGTVVADLTRLQSFLAKRHRYRGYSRDIGTALRRLKSGQTKVLSDKLNQCKYG